MLCCGTAVPQLSYYGGSYGTRIGPRYADLFPTRIKRMVLDAVVDPAQENKAFLIDAARARSGGWMTIWPAAIAVLAARSTG